jgi:hypothetical protein
LYLQVYLIYISAGYEYKNKEELDFEFTESETSDLAFKQARKAGVTTGKFPKAKRDSDSSCSSTTSFTNVTITPDSCKPSPTVTRKPIHPNVHQQGYAQIQQADAVSALLTSASVRRAFPAEAGNGMHSVDDQDITNRERLQRSDTINSTATISTQLLYGSRVTRADTEGEDFAAESAFFDLSPRPEDVTEIR